MHSFLPLNLADSVVQLENDLVLVVGRMLKLGTSPLTLLESLCCSEQSLLSLERSNKILLDAHNDL